MNLRLVALAIVVGLSSASASAQYSRTPGRTADVGVDHVVGVIIYSNDMLKSEQFYTQVLGLKIHAHIPAVGPPVEIMLSKSDDTFSGANIIIQGTKNDVNRSDPNRVHFGSISFFVKSNEEIAARLIKAGYPVAKGDALHYSSHDPDGYRVNFYQVNGDFPPRPDIDAMEKEAREKYGK